MKTALITGIRGQDGAYLAKLLLEKGYKVYGADRRSGDSSNWRLKELGIDSDVQIVYMDLLELTNILRTIEKIRPDEVYNLAAQSFVKVSFDQPILTADIDAMGVLRLLEALRTYNPSARFYQASTSEMFGKVQEVPQSEKTPFHPRSPYGVAKLFSHWMTVNYRESYGMFCCSGILFNHESPLRGLEFVTRKLTHAIARIKAGLQDKVVVGNLNAKRDWGYALEYVDAMWRMLQQETPDDYVVATGETHTVREWIECAFAAAGYRIVWKGSGVNERGLNAQNGQVLVEVSEEFFRPAEVELLIGDATKARERLGWQPQTTFQHLLEIMVEADMKRVLETR
ncbi:MAG: GDP-mannose 4,6-dehydratase [Deltaproteobacteria bacterium]|jgi:GDPmannose 4,6-dehydratase|nr:GDP-mannose 4,6-dehydratase [Deltaproteobacteria bacterium]